MSKGEHKMDRLANNEKLLNFLVYSYFGCDIKELADGGKKKCARRAYLDLARTVKYKYSSSELDKAKKDPDKCEYRNMQNNTITNTCQNLISSIENYPGDNTDFDSWHKNECRKIQDTMNDTKLDNGEKLLKEDFTFGQAQKWVNMTLKYLWLLDMLPKGISAEDLHVPIDSFILEALKNDNSDISCKDGTYKYQGEAWSQLTTDNYDTIQKEIRKVAKKKENNTPIEWESTAWIKVAKERSND